MRYGRVQNALLLGNRNGVSLQLAPEQLPKRPFDPLYLQAEGITGSYRVNGTSWAFDAPAASLLLQMLCSGVR